MKYSYVREFLDLDYYNENYNNVRSQLHEKIVDKHFNKTTIKTDKLKIIFNSGAYGCGKSHILKLLQENNKINLNEYIFVNPDNLRDELPEYKELIKSDPWNAGKNTNKEVFYIGELIRYHAMLNGYNVIYDSSLKDKTWFLEHIKWLRERFPKAIIKIIHVKANWINVLERNLLRAEETKRCIPLRFIKEAYAMSIKSNEILKNYVDENIIIENDNDENTTKFVNNNIKNI